MTYNAPSLRLLLLLTATTWACDSDTAASTDGGQSGTSSTSAETEPEGTDGSESTNAGGTSGSTSTGEAVCELPQDETLDGSEVTITIENATDEPRFVSPYSIIECNYSPVEVLVDGEPIRWDHEGAFHLRCTQCRPGGCSDGGAEGLIINPGQTAEISWNGGVWANTPLSEACGQEACDASESWVEGDALPPECQVIRPMEDIAYTVRVNVFDTCPGSVVERDGCTCDDDVCETFFYEPSAGEYTVEVDATFPAGASIVLE